MDLATLGLRPGLEQMHRGATCLCVHSALKLWASSQAHLPNDIYISNAKCIPFCYITSSTCRQCLLRLSCAWKCKKSHSKNNSRTCIIIMIGCVLCSFVSLGTFGTCSSLWQFWDTDTPQYLSQYPAAGLTWFVPWFFWDALFPFYPQILQMEGLFRCYRSKQAQKDPLRANQSAFRPEYLPISRLIVPFPSG